MNRTVGLGGKKSMLKRGCCVTMITTPAKYFIPITKVTFRGTVVSHGHNAAETNMDIDEQKQNVCNINFYEIY